MFDVKRLVFDALVAALLPMSCISAGCAFQSDGLHVQGGFGPAIAPVVKWRLDTGMVDFKFEVTKFAEVPPVEATPQG